jgi:hypothetical protein
MAIAGLMAVTATSCGIDSKLNELLNPPAKKTTPQASFTTNTDNAKVGTPIILDASSSSDPQGEALTYAWTLDVPTGSVAKLGSATTSSTSFTPDKGGYYMASLVTTNVSAKKSAVATLQVNVVGTGTNHPPVAITTTAVAVTTGNAAVLDGSSSYDADKQTLYYTWTLLGKPSTSAVRTISDDTIKTAYFTPDVAGIYNVKFEVSDGTDSDQALVTVTVTAQTTLSIPKASFTVDNSTVRLGTPVRLDATASYDPQAKVLTYAWSLQAPKGSSSTLTSATTVVTSFTPDKGGKYLVYLKVTNSSSIPSDTVTSLVNAVGTGNNYPPVAITTSALTKTVASVVFLDGTQSYDADQQTLTYAWTLINKPPTSALAGITDSALPTGYFTPDVAGTYNIKFVVSDGTDSDQVFVAVTVN